MIRPCVPGDEAEVLALWEEFDRFHCRCSSYYFRLPTEEERLKRHRKYAAGERSLCLVSEQRSRITGFLCGQRRRTPGAALLRERTILELHALFVGQDFRESGVGRSLIEAAVLIGRKEEVDDVEAHIWNFNQPILPLMTDLGFQMISGKYGLTLHE